MALQPAFRGLGAWMRRYHDRRVLGAWTMLTVIVAVYVYVSVAFFDLFAPRMRPVFGLTITPVSLGVLGVLLGGGVLAWWTRHPLPAVSTALLIGIAALSVNLGCPGVECLGAERFRVFVEWTFLGPAVSVSQAAGRCADHCPHTVELLPLALGYLLLGNLILATDS